MKLVAALSLALLMSGCLLLIHDPEGTDATSAGGATDGASGTTSTPTSVTSSSSSTSTSMQTDCVDRLASAGAAPGPIALELVSTAANNPSVYFSDLAVDVDGSVAFVGIFTGTTTTPIGAFSCPNGIACMFAGAVAPSGSLNWIANLGYTGVAPHVAFRAGEIVVAGDYTVWLVGLAVPGNPNGFVARFTKAGSLIDRRDLAFPNVLVEPIGFAMDPTGNVYLGGIVQSAAAAPFNACNTSVTMTGQHAFVASLDASGTCTDLQVWQPAGSDAVYSLGFAGPTNKLGVAGVFTGSLILPPDPALTSANKEAFVAEGSVTNKLPVWSKSLAIGPVAAAMPEGTMLVSKDGSTYAGVVYGPDSLGLMPVSANADVVFFDDAGVFGRRIASPGVDYVMDVEAGVSSSGMPADRPIVLAGNAGATSSLDFGNGVGLTFNPTVTAGWLALFDGDGVACRALGFAADDHGSVVTHVAIASGSLVVGSNNGEAGGSRAKLTTIAFGDLPKP